MSTSPMPSSPPLHAPPAEKQPFTPRTMMMLFTFLNFCIYYDRALGSAVLDIWEREDIFGLSGVQQGMVASAFMVGFVAASPGFARLANRMNPLRVMAIGLGVWCYATAISGLAPNFYVLLLARALTGVGEASFVSLAPPLIDKLSPPDKRSKNLSIFFIALPLGLATGFALGSFWAGDKDTTDNTGAFGLTDKDWGWRTAFLFESLVMLPFVVLLALRDGRYSFEDDADEAASGSPASVAGGGGGGGAGKVRAATAGSAAPAAAGGAAGKEPAERESLEAEVRELTANPVYLCIVLGYSAQVFVTGAFAVYGKEYVVEALGYKDGEAGALFGGTTAVCGIVGTAAGGIFVDRLRNQKPDVIAGAEPDDLTVAAGGGASAERARQDRNLVLVCTVVLIFSTLCWPAGVLAFVMGSLHRGFFFLFLAVSMIFLFAALTPINNAILWCTPYRLNPLALALSVVVTHLLGDALSPVLVGALHDRTRAWNETMIIASSWLAFSVFFFALALYYAQVRARRHGVKLAKGELILFDGDDPASPDELGTPLLSEDDQP